MKETQSNVADGSFGDTNEDLGVVPCNVLLGEFLTHEILKMLELIFGDSVPLSDDLGSVGGHL